jgi:hypothetical protein
MFDGFHLFESRKELLLRHTARRYTKRYSATKENVIWSPRKVYLVHIALREASHSANGSLLCQFERHHLLVIVTYILPL